MGLFECPYRNPQTLAKKIHTEENISLAQQIAEESIVLLKNTGSLLPLDKRKIQSIAVIDPNADKVQFGDKSFRSLVGLIP